MVSPYLVFVVEFSGWMMGSRILHGRLARQKDLAAIRTATGLE